MNLQSFIASEACLLDSAEQSAAKKAAGEAALRLVEDGMRVGLGTGSTVRFFLEGLARRIKDEGLRIKGVPTSTDTERLARQYEIPLVEGGFTDLDSDICVDGADRIDGDGNLIKGGGGALLREKMIASASAKPCILADPLKLEAIFSGSFPLPIEVVPFGIDTTMAKLEARGCRAQLRMDSKKPRVSDNGLWIVDCTFDKISDPSSLESELLHIPGVAEVGLFCGVMKLLVLGRADGSAVFFS